MIGSQIYSEITYFIWITFKTDAIWTVLPLVVSTLFMMVYFGIYREEKADWNTNFSNSLVLLFVSIALFRHIYSINNAGAVNFIEEWGKTLISVLILSIGLFVVKFNFEHLLPIKTARYINSPITINLGAYAVILLVYSAEKINWVSVISVLIMVLVLMAILILIKWPMGKLRKYMEKEKKKERLDSIKEEKFEINELREQLQEREKELNVLKLRELDKEKKEVIRLKKAIKK